MENNTGSPPANPSRASMSLDSIAYAIHQNMRASLELKTHVENLIAGRSAAPTYSSTLPLATLKLNILESLTRAHAANIVTHHLLLEVIENDRKSGKPEVNLDVRAILKGATEEMDGARRLQEKVLVREPFSQMAGDRKLTE
jgi:hypothetical protein